MQARGLLHSDEIFRVVMVPVSGTPVCAGRAVTERFALKMTSFYDKESRDTFSEGVRSDVSTRRALENTLPAGVVLIVLLVVGVTLGVIAGV